MRPRPPPFSSVACGIATSRVSNALKFTREGHVAVRLGERDGLFVLDVSDTGVGIPKEELPRVFDRFHRVPSTWARTHEGTGIGLALVRELLEMHGGRARVASEPGRGTTFTVELPKGFAHLPADAV
jgi:signal transduction histidine kinase